MYSISQAARDPNPAADRYPVLTDADFVTLCYPAIDETSRGGKRLSPSARSNRQSRAREVIEGMADKATVSSKKWTMDYALCHLSVGAQAIAVSGVASNR